MTVGVVVPQRARCLLTIVEVSRRAYSRGSPERGAVAVEMQFGLESGRPEEWQRLKIANLQ
jgi:hypothetical protein